MALKQFHRLACLSLSQNKRILTRTLKIKIQVQEYSKFSGSSSGSLNMDELVLNLDETERTALKTALDKLQSNVVKQKLEGKRFHVSLNSKVILCFAP